MLLIGGLAIILEIDLSKFGRRNYNKVHRMGEVWVLGIIERTNKSEIVLILVPNRNKETLHA